MSCLWTQHNDAGEARTCGPSVSMKVVLTLANIADPDEMQQYGLHYLPKYPLGVSSIQRVKGVNFLLVLFP